MVSKAKNRANLRRQIPKLEVASKDLLYVGKMINELQKVMKMSSDIEVGQQYIDMINVVASRFGAHVRLFEKLPKFYGIECYLLKDTSMQRIPLTISYACDRVWKRCPNANNEWRTIKDRENLITWIE